MLYITENSFAIATCTFSMVLLGWGGATSLTDVVYLSIESLI